MSRMKTAVALTIGVFAAHAWAGEFFERDGAAIRGYDPVAYFTDGKATRGSPEYTTQYQGSTFQFSSREHRDAFAADPEKYAPQYRGYCAYGTSTGYKAAVDPSEFTIVNGKLYLNYNEDVRKTWSKDILGYITKADARWPEVSRQTKVIE